MTVTSNNLSLVDSEEIEDLEIPEILGIPIAVPKWEAFITIMTLSLMIFITVVGNILVILSVLNHTPLKILSNYFVVSLAVADLTVAITVLPLNVAYSVLGKWVFGSITCKIWLTADVLCCTASILNLCAIALDRYWAIHDPINYATKRTTGRVYCMIVLVWAVSCIICLPPLIGWNDWPEHFTTNTPCMLTEEKGYIMYSSFGSFFIPLFLILFLYFKIFLTQSKMANKRKMVKTGEGKKQVAVEVNQPSTSNSVKNGKEETEIHKSPESVSKNGKEEKKKHRRHILALVKEKNSIMYQKSVNAGSQSDISRRGSSLADMNGNGHTSEMSEALNVNVVTYVSQSYDDLGKHKGNHHSVGDKSIQETNGKHCMHNQNMKLLDEQCESQASCDKSSSSPETSDTNYVEKEKIETFKAKLRVQVFIRRQKDFGKNQSKEQKAARTMAVIVVTFIVCWLPFFTMYVILPFCSTCTVHRRVQIFITWLGYLNSTLNPIIYTIFNPYFRQAFRNLLSCKK